MEKIALKEAVVVEGRDDEAAVLRAVDAAVLPTHGWGMPEESLERIESAAKRQGIIVLTDPDHAGEEIRRKLRERFPEAKHAYLSRPDAEKRKDGRAVDVGVENAAPEAIRDALLAARAEIREQPQEDPVTAADLIALGLAGRPGSDALRQAAGRELGIGSCNAKAFCRRLSASGISREELLAVWRRISQENR
ncbi:MAG: ribonuclease M5 [Clostridia bacterium]|nr:ribonuclease M5 [Clostridia bacterium]